MSGILASLTQWFSERPRRLQVAATRQLQVSELSNKDISELATLCRQEADGECPKTTCSFPASAFSHGAAGTLRLCSISNFERVNALVPKKPLEFGKSSITFVYGNIGFRIFRLDSSNWKPWDDTFVAPANRDLFVERMRASLDPVKPGRSDLDMVYEVMLKYGVPLTEPVTPLAIEGKTFYAVHRRGTMLVCLDKDITVETVEAVLAQHTPGVMIFADACFNNNSDLTNAALILEKAGIEFRWI